MPNTGFSFKIQSDYLVAFLEGDKDAQEEFFLKYHRRFLWAAKRMAPDLASRDLAEDVVQEMYVLLLSKPVSAFDPGRGSADSYLNLILRTAARDVRAHNVSPGNRTRLQKGSDGLTIIPKKPLSLDSPMCIDEFDGAISLYELVPDEYDSISEADAIMEAEWIMNAAWDTASEPIPEALELIYFNDYQISEAADAIRIHRSTLRRRIDKWAEAELVPVR